MDKFTDGFQNSHFLSIPLKHGQLADFSKGMLPTKIHAWESEELTFTKDNTVFGYVVEGPAFLASHLQKDGSLFSLQTGMYFCVPGPMVIHGGTGIVMERIGYKGMFMIGGPIEHVGRLQYIDGCTDSLLIPPVVKGDPCFNYLHFPSGISQTRHTHPSIRCGLVARGRGLCVVPANDDGTGSDVEIPLVPGRVFVIPPDGQHSFSTSDSTMEIVVYHPDSDTGSSDNDHPMLNRTMVDGISAAKLAQFRPTAALAGT